jgi:hypothetical protein
MKLKQILINAGNTILSIAGFCGTVVGLMFMIVVCNFLNLIKIANILFTTCFYTILAGSNIGLYNLLRQWFGVTSSLVFTLLIACGEVLFILYMKHDIAVNG